MKDGYLSAAPIWAIYGKEALLDEEDDEKLELEKLLLELENEDELNDDDELDVLTELDEELERLLLEDDCDCDELEDVDCELLELLDDRLSDELEELERDSEEELDDDTLSEELELD